MSVLTTYQQQHLDQKGNYPELATLNSTSKVSVWRLWVYVVSFVANTVRELVSIHKDEINWLIEQQRVTGLKYYQEKVLQYRYGHPFDRENLVYTGVYTDAEIVAAQIVKRAAVLTINRDGRQILFIKLATIDINGKLAKIDAPAMLLVQDYMFPNTAAGTNIEYYSDNADELKMDIDVYIDPQILSVDGTRIDGSSNTPIPDAIDAFLSDLNFNFKGELIVSKLERALENLEGVIDNSVKVKSAYANYQTPANWQLIDESYIANSGYMEILSENLTINYLPKYAQQ